MIILRHATKVTLPLNSTQNFVLSQHQAHLVKFPATGQTLLPEVKDLGPLAGFTGEIEEPANKFNPQDDREMIL